MDFDTIQVTRFEQNCSLLRCGQTGSAAVIDPGGDAVCIRDLLEWEDLRLEAILVTHGHMDHAGAAADLADLTGAPIIGPHRADAPLVSDMKDFGARHSFSCRSYIPSRWLEHGDEIRFGSQVLEVLHCPGHTPGHVAYFHRSSGWAFVGDILFKGAIGQWDLPDGNLPQLLRSTREKLFPLGDEVRFVPGHGHNSSFGHEREHNPFVGDRAIAAWQAQRAAATSGT